MNAHELLKDWQQADLIKLAEIKNLESFILTETQTACPAEELPLYFRFFSGLGALLAAYFFIRFLQIIKLIHFAASYDLLAKSAIFIGAAIVLAALLPKPPKPHTILQHFCLQLSLCFMFIGKIFFLQGFSALLNNGGFYNSWNIALSAALVTVATYYLYRVSVDQFFWVSFVFIALFISIVTHLQTISMAAFMLHIAFFLVLFLAAALILFKEKFMLIQENYLPLAYGAIFTLCIVTLAFTLKSYYFMPKLHLLYDKKLYLIFMNLLLTLSLLGLIAHIAGSMTKLKTVPFMAAFAGAILLGFMSAPGIIFSVCVMLLGKKLEQKILLRTGFIIFPLFLFLYYYNLDITLMAKSGILMASGLLLLAAYFVTQKMMKQEKKA